MAQHFSRPRTAPQPFSEAQDPALTSGLFWARLLAYRPLFLLGGLWLTLVCVSAIAYHGLMFNQPLEDTTHRDAPLTIATPLPSDLAPAADPEPAEVESLHVGMVTLWGLLSLVGLCAFGSFVLTQYIKAQARPRKKNRKKKARPVSQAPPRPRTPQPKRLTPYSPERDSVVVPGARVVNTPPLQRPTVSAPVAASGAADQPGPQTAPQSEAQPLPTKLAVAQGQPRTPTVVPQGADLALDWSEGSVAHALDVRQRRSLSSFM